MIDFLLAAAAMVAQSQAGTAPMAAPAWRLQHEPGLGNYLSQPERTGDDRYQAWSWSVRSNRLTPDAVDAFLNVYDCRSGQFRRLRQERYSQGRLFSVNAREAGWRAPTAWEMEERQLAEICSGALARRPQVSSIDQARRDVRAAR